MVRVFPCSGDIQVLTTGDLRTFKNPFKIPDETEAQKFMRSLAKRAKDELSDPSIVRDPVRYGGIFSKWLYNYSLSLPPLDGLPEGRGVLAHHLQTREINYDYKNHIIIPTWEAAYLEGADNVFTLEELAELERLGGRPHLRRYRSMPGIISCLYVKTLLLLARRPYSRVRGSLKDGLGRKAMSEQDAVLLMGDRGLIYNP